MPAAFYNGIMIRIYGTLGPSCTEEAVIQKMFEAGMMGMRLNMSHTSLRESSHLIDCFHRAAQKAGIAHPELLIDLQGPELRIGVLKEPMNLAEEETGELSSIPFQEEVINAIQPEDHILLDDGKILLQAQESGMFKVLRGGILSSRKSVKIEERNIYLPALTEQDRINLNHAGEYGVTGVMQPFTRRKEDLMELKQAIRESGAPLEIFAKIENREGVSNLEELIPFADEIVIARGDLANDTGLFELPEVQDEIARTCRKKNCRFMVVTQMVASMTSNPVPTRAEVTDIFHAIMQGASTLMVTNETAVGKYPVEVIRTMVETARKAEEYRNH